MDKLNIKDGKTVIKVGNSTIDIEEGRNAGCIHNIGVTTGAHSQSELLTAKPDCILDDIYALKALII